MGAFIDIYSSYAVYIDCFSDQISKKLMLEECLCKDVFYNQNSDSPKRSGTSEHNN